MDNDTQTRESRLKPFLQALDQHMRMFGGTSYLDQVSIAMMLTAVCFRRVLQHSPKAYNRLQIQALEKALVADFAKKLRRFGEAEDGQSGS